MLAVSSDCGRLILIDKQLYECTTILEKKTLATRMSIAAAAAAAAAVAPSTVAALHGATADEVVTSSQAEALIADDVETVAAINKQQQQKKKRTMAASTTAATNTVPKPTHMVLTDAFGEHIVIQTCTAIKLMRRESEIAKHAFFAMSGRDRMPALPLPAFLMTPCQRYLVAIIGCVPRDGVQRHDHLYYRVVWCPPEERAALYGPAADAAHCMANRYTWDNAHELMRQTLTYKKTSSSMQYLYVPWMAVATLKSESAVTTSDDVAAAPPAPTITTITAAATTTTMTTATTQTPRHQQQASVILRNLSVQWLTKRWGGPGFQASTPDQCAQLLFAKTWTSRNIMGGFRRTPNSHIHSLAVDLSTYERVKRIL
jgi:hypothetical protein